MLSRLSIAVLTCALLCNNVIATPSYPVTYCSTFNTASGSGTASIYQSEGLCHETCLASYAFAVLKDDTCWCTNYIPGTGVTSNSNCNSACPGFPSDYCGNSGSGLYGYIALNKKAAGTSGAVTSTSAQAARGSTTTAPGVAQISTVTASAIPVTIPVTITPQTVTPFVSSRSSSTSTSDLVTTTSQAGVVIATTQAAATSTTSITPAATTLIPTISILTISGGGYQTITVTPAAQATSAQSSVPIVSNDGGGGGISTGGAVGLTIGLVALVAIIAAMGACCYRKRKKQREIEEAAAYEEVSARGSTAGGIPQRTMSENSRYMLNTDGNNRIVEAWQEGGPGARASQMIPVDPRLDPFSPVYQRGDANKSRESVATINDGHDYSRRMLSNKGPLRAVNV